MSKAPPVSREMSSARPITAIVSADIGNGSVVRAALKRETSDAAS